MFHRSFPVLLVILVVACAQVPPTPTPVPSPIPTATPAPVPSATPALDASTPSLVLSNATLIDGTGAAPVFNAVVVVREGRIAALGSKDRVPIPPNAQTLDLNGATVLPGLFNAHVHGAYDAEHLKAWAAAGVTTVCDLGARATSVEYASQLYNRRQSEFASPQYARILSASPILTAPGGGYGLLAITSPEDARDQVNRLLDRGADVIKISLEDNLQGRRWTVMPLENAKAIVAAAHERGVPVSAHISRPYQVEWALEVGVDSLAHMVIDPLPDDIFPRLVARDVYWIPTMELWYGVGWGPRADPNLRKFLAAGGKVALGTDFDGYTVPFDHGLPVHEIEYLQAAGMTPPQILVAATKNAAHVCNRERDLGTLEVGKIADILVVDGDPLAGIHALQKVHVVIHNGEVVN